MWDPFQTPSPATDIKICRCPSFLLPSGGTCMRVCRHWRQRDEWVGCMESSQCRTSSGWWEGSSESREREARPRFSCLGDSVPWKLHPCSSLLSSGSDLLNPTPSRGLRGRKENDCSARHLRCPHHCRLSWWSPPLPPAGLLKGMAPLARKQGGQAQQKKLSRGRGGGHQGRWACWGWWAGLPCFVLPSSLPRSPLPGVRPKRVRKGREVACSGALLLEVGRPLPCTH